MRLSERDLKISPWLWILIIVSMSLLVVGQLLSRMGVAAVTLVCIAVAVAAGSAVMLILGIRHRRRAETVTPQDRPMSE